MWTSTLPPPFLLLLGQTLEDLKTVQRTNIKFCLKVIHVNIFATDENLVSGKKSRKQTAVKESAQNPEVAHQERSMTSSLLVMKRANQRVAVLIQWIRSIMHLNLKNPEQELKEVI